MNVLTISKDKKSFHIESLAFKKMGLNLIIATSFEELTDIYADKIIDCFFFYWEPDYREAILCLQAVAENPSFKKVPKIILATDFTEKDKDILSDFEIDLYITQPIPQNQLIKRLKKLLHKPVREEERIHTEPIGTFEFSAPTGRHRGTIKNLSLSGALLTCEQAPPEEPVFIDLKLYLDGLTHPLESSAEIVRHENTEEQSTNIAIKFMKFQRNSKLDLKTFLRKNRDDDRLQYYI